MKLELELPVRIESLNLGQRLGIGRNTTLAKLRRQRFAQRGKVARLRNVAHLVLKAKLGRRRRLTIDEGERLVITLTRFAPGELDDDNLAAGFKPVRDGLADALGLDDGDRCLRWFYRQERAPRGRYTAHVLLELMMASELGARLAAAEEASA